ncbi:MAG: hypothetical protein ACO3DT_15660 [Gammaproteobacteria bacterium]
MSRRMAMTRSCAIPSAVSFRPFRLLTAVLVLLILVSLASRWYAAEVSLPRYCAEPEATLYRLAAVISEERPAGDESRREFIVAAKLRYLMPAQVDERDGEYLQRLRVYLEEQCQ